jgi:hypothetical protein
MFYNILIEECTICNTINEKPIREEEEGDDCNVRSALQSGMDANKTCSCGARLKIDYREKLQCCLANN